MKSFERAVDQLRKLPGVGRKTARRLVFHLVSIAEGEVKDLARSLVEVKRNLRFCETCFSLAEEERCAICRDDQRDDDVLCVVAYPEDVFTVEDAQSFRGRYHVLRGLISPLDGVGPDQLTITELLGRIGGDSVREIIFAFNPTNEGEVTMNYLQKRFPDHVALSHLGYGIPVGSDIEYTDQMTLSRAFENRVQLNGPS